MKGFIIEFGTGIDLHGADPTKAAKRAIDDAIHRSCLCGLPDYAQRRDLGDVVITVQIACPHPASVDQAAIREHFPFGTIEVSCEEGGLLTQGAYDEALGRRTEILVAVVSLTVYVGGASPAAQP